MPEIEALEGAVIGALRGGDLAGVRAILPAAEAAAPGPLKPHYRALRSVLDGDDAAAAAAWEALLESREEATARLALRYFRLIGRAAQRAGRGPTLAASLDRLTRSVPGISVAAPEYDPEHVRRAEARRQALAGAGLPSILLCVMPTSAGSVLHDRLHAALGNAGHRISTHTEPDHVVPAWLEAFFAAGGAVGGNLTEASDASLDALGRAGVPRVLVHVCHPGAALVRLVDHVTRVVLGHPLRRLEWPYDLPPGWNDWDDPRRIDWAAEHHLPRLAAWARDWHAVAADPRRRGALEVLVTDDAALETDEAAVFGRIAAFYGLPPTILYRGGGRPAVATAWERRLGPGALARLEAVLG
ncbi:MAG: hypothetical protein GC201_03725 [Alphaproteobacteria bacterium]|nr:hypothetical protein [Alphaproteobacteria bacterium]